MHSSILHLRIALGHTYGLSLNSNPILSLECELTCVRMSCEPCFLLSLTRYKAEWIVRGSTHPEDPFISVNNHNTASPGEVTLVFYSFGALIYSFPGLNHVTPCFSLNSALLYMYNSPFTSNRRYFSACLLVYEYHGSFHFPLTPVCVSS